MSKGVTTTTYAARIYLLPVSVEDLIRLSKTRKTKDVSFLPCTAVAATAAISFRSMTNLFNKDVSVYWRICCCLQLRLLFRALTQLFSKDLSCLPGTLQLLLLQLRLLFL
jgi:hypothetical protein